jgi:CDP-diacylglycerol--glycerol-3-phosphate 3-phosphatidyltransferase
VVLVGLAAVFCGITAHFVGGNYKLFIKGISFHIFEPMSVLTVPITFLAIFSNVTAIQRLMDAKESQRQKEIEMKEKEKLTVSLKRDAPAKAMALLILFSILLLEFAFPINRMA